MLRWLGPRLHDRALWRLQRHAVARGVAIGLFFAFVLPVAQIPIAALSAFALRANLWASAAATLVSNPLTYAPIYYAAFRIGGWIVGLPDGVTAFGDGPPDAVGLAGWFDFWGERLRLLGKPLIVGVSVLAVVGAFVGYFGTLLLWRIAVVRRRRRALRSRARY